MAGFGWGIRHVQAICMFICITSLIVVRSSMGVAVLAMADKSRINDTGIEVRMEVVAINYLVLNKVIPPSRTPIICHLLRKSLIKINC